MSTFCINKILPTYREGSSERAEKLKKFLNQIHGFISWPNENSARGGNIIGGCVNCQKLKRGKGKEIPSNRKIMRFMYAQEYVDIYNMEYLCSKNEFSQTDSFYNHSHSWFMLFLCNRNICLFVFWQDFRLFNYRNSLSLQSWYEFFLYIFLLYKYFYIFLLPPHD